MTTGSGSSFPITRVAAKYLEMKQDGRYLSNKAGLEILDDRLIQLFERVDFGESPERVAKLHQLWEEFVEEPNGAEQAMLKKKIGDEFEKIYHDYAAWKQISEIMDLRSKMQEREVKILREIKAIMTAEDAYELAAKMLAASMNVIGDDPKKLKRLQYEYTRIVGQSSDFVIEGHSEDDWGGGEEVGGEA